MTRALVLAPVMLAILLAPLSAPVQANDPRIVERLYDPARVVRIEGRTKVQATIAFGEDETIENVAIGDSTAWQVTPNKRANLLFIKPLEPSASTNMTVITNRHTYLFDLVANPRARPLYVLRFTYPEAPEDEQAVQVAQAPVETANATELAAVTDPYAVLDPAELNFEWARKGDNGLLPARVFDDGSATFLTWPEGAAVPAVLVKDSEGTEGPVNFSVRGETLVLDGVPAEIILRSGEAVASLTHMGPVRPPASLAQNAMPNQAENR